MAVTKRDPNCCHPLGDNKFMERLLLPLPKLLWGLHSEEGTAWRGTNADAARGSHLPRAPVVHLVTVITVTY